VLFTGKEREEIVIRALNHGADFYLQKGGDINVIFLELENIIKKLVDQWYLKITLEQSEQRYRLLVDNAQEGIYIIQNERIVSSNIKFLHLIHSLGFSSDDIETTPSIFDFIHPEDKKELRERYYLRISHSINDNISRFRAIDKNGLIHYFQVHAVNTEWNEKPATLNFLQDITYQQSLNSIHHNHENHFRELVDNLPKTVIELDLNFFLIYINKVGIKKLGYNLENLIGNTHITDLFIQSDQEKFIHHVSMIVNEESDYSKEYTIVKKDGNTFPVKVYISPIYLENRLTGYRIVCVDISEEMRAKMALEQVNKQLNLMTNITRHDILNKITALLILQSFSLELTDNPNMIELLKKQEQITKLIQQNIEFTQYYQEIGIQSPDWHNLKQIVNSVISEINNTTFLIDEHIPDCFIYTDKLFKNVILNLFENTIMHGDDVSKISISTEKSGKNLIIVYSDDGIGVPPDKKEQIFNSGFGNHTGFGLYLIREILSITGIVIKETGIYGEGAKFEIIIPYGSYRFA
jgi:PAS domain S-box-containing protein